MHNEKPVWIVFYEEVRGHHSAFYQAYLAVQKVPHGRLPWTIDNRCIGNPWQGFKTLADAMDAAEGAVCAPRVAEVRA